MNVLDQKQKAQIEALWAVGQFQRIDIVLAILTLGAWAAFAIAALKGNNFQREFALAIAALAFNLLWITVLVYRGIYFVLQLTAAVKLMPEDAARLALAFQRGQAYQNREPQVSAQS